MKLRIGRLALVLITGGLLAVGASVSAVYAQATTRIVMAEFTFTPANVTVPAGRVTFTLQNTGQFPHNVHIEGNGVSEDVDPNGNVEGGQTFTGTVNLPAGRYEIWCPVDAHRDRGMVGTLTVAGAAAGGAAQVPGRLPNTGSAPASDLPMAPIGAGLGIVLVGAGLLLRRAAARR